MKLVSTLTACSLALAAATPARAIDLVPGDVRAPRPGYDLLQVSWVGSERGDAYRNGEHQPGNPGLVSEQWQFRYGHSFEAAGMPAYFYLQTPVGKLDPQGSLAALDGDSGLGDTTALLSFWPYANRTTETYFGIAGYLTVPTGEYDHNRRINMGGNRTQTALQAGYQKMLAENLHGMLAFDTLWSGDNDDYGTARATLAQKPLYSSQAALFYKFDERFTLGTSLFHTEGGETRLAGADRHDRTSVQRYQLSAIGYFPFGRLILQYGGDLKTENGQIEDRRVALRYALIF